MSYTADYWLSQDLPDEKKWEFIKVYIDKFGEKTLNESDLEILFDGFCLDRDWRNLTEEMKEMSRLFPDEIFTITGKGEDEESMWQEHFKNGKTQFCSGYIEYEPFDESKMK